MTQTISHHTSTDTISISALLALLDGNDEFALVDVREQGVYARDGHIIHAVSLPLSKLELAVWPLVPRRSAKLIVTDAGDGALAQRALARLRQLGFTDVALLEGGVAAWQAAGQQVYTGSSSYSKAFGEFVEHTYATPHVSPQELKTWLDKDEVVLLDGRTLGEFEDFSIPGAHAVPNAELPLRVHALVPDATTRIVVNCAGRTRSIIGAQALINAGIKNPVAALEDGTMAWLFDGLALQHGAPAQLANAPASTLPALKASVAHLTQRYALDWIDQAALDALFAERDSRSLYLLDVRTKAEFDAGHLPGSRWAEGGELVQGLDKFVGVRGARIVVIDDGAGVRAAITASWLQQLNRGDVYVHLLPATPPTTYSAHAAAAPIPAAGAPVTPQALKTQLEQGSAVVIDLTTSLDYENGHIPGAHFAIRARLDAGVLQNLAPGKTLVLTSGDGKLAGLAAADLAQAGIEQLYVLVGGTAAWRAAGLPLESGATSLLHPAEDVWRSPYQVPDQFAAFRTYLDWERELLNQLDQDATVRFRVFSPAR